MSEEPIIPVVLLCALPASGKSESRAFLRSLPVEKSRAEFKIGFPTVQLDDYPYVEMLKFFDKELKAQGQERPFYYSEYYTFKNPYTWGVLVEMLNEDYFDVINKHAVETTTPTKWICDRIIRISEKHGLGNPFANITPAAMEKLYERYNDHCAKFIKEKNEYATTFTKDRTIIIEFARGGGCGSRRYPDFFPLPEPFGYQYSLRQFCPEILSSCAMLYIQVTPEQSFEKNLARAPPVGYTGPTDIFHSVPDCVMLCDYGCDDFEYLLKKSDKENTIKVEKYDCKCGCHGGPDLCEGCVKKGEKGGEKKVYYIPVGVFDNREDLTTFCRGEPKDWPKESIEKIYKAMTAAFSGLLSQWKSLHTSK